MDLDTILGVDTGGTFTDFVCYHNQHIRIHKVLSTPQAPEQAILQGIKELGLSHGGLLVIHGSTVATNAVLEGNGVRTVFITNRGFRDMLAIGRQARKELYRLTPENPGPVIAEELCLETGGRLAHDGSLVEPLTGQDLQTLKTQLEQIKPEAVAINLLFSYLQPELEQQIATVVPEEVFVSCSSEVLPEYKEYERGITTWLNAWIGPRVQGYLQRLEQGIKPARLKVMLSSGDSIDADQAGRKAVNMLLSGPAGGLQAAVHIGRQAGFEQLLSFDMGGTSTDVAMLDGRIRLTTEGRIAGFPVAVPMVDMHTIGAGGGSLAYVDAGGMLHVGPESAGASPGPACYGQGGQQPTVTDANLLLGRLLPDAFLGGRMQLDVEAARQALQPLAEAMGVSVEEAASGIIRVANEHMVRALRVISLQRGVDPRDFVLMSFGGAGGLHVCALAEAMQMQQAIVPVNSGVLSAQGMLFAPVGRQFSRTVNRLANLMKKDELIIIINELKDSGMAELGQEGVQQADIKVSCSLDCRYSGQSYYLNVEFDPQQMTLADSTQAFHQAHESLYGHGLDEPVELVNIRLAVSGPEQDIKLPVHETAPAQGQRERRVYGLEQAVPVYQRHELVVGEVLPGPLLVTEEVATTWVAPGWTVLSDQQGHLILRR